MSKYLGFGKGPVDVGDWVLARPLFYDSIHLGQVVEVNYSNFDTLRYIQVKFVPSLAEYDSDLSNEWLNLGNNPTSDQIEAMRRLVCSQ